VRSGPLSIAGCFVYLNLTSGSESGVSTGGLNGNEGGLDGTKRQERRGGVVPQNAGRLTWGEVMKLANGRGARTEIWAGHR
jgi:hypothetical protein